MTLAECLVAEQKTPEFQAGRKRLLELLQNPDTDPAVVDVWRDSLHKRLHAAVERQLKIMGKAPCT